MAKILNVGAAYRCERLMMADSEGVKMRIFLTDTKTRFAADLSFVNFRCPSILRSPTISFILIIIDTGFFSVATHTRSILLIVMGISDAVLFMVVFTQFRLT